MLYIKFSKQMRRIVSTRLLFRELSNIRYLLLVAEQQTPIGQCLRIRILTLSISSFGCTSRHKSFHLPLKNEYTCIVTGWLFCLKKYNYF